MRRMVLMVMVLGLAVMLGFNLACQVKASQAKEEDLATGVMDRLNKVIGNQQVIIEKLDEMKKELYVIKIRVTHK